MFEVEDSATKDDRQVLWSVLRESDIEYRHIRGRDDPGLWTADAVAWCRQRGGESWRHASPVVSAIDAV